MGTAPAAAINLAGRRLTQKTSRRAGPANYVGSLMDYNARCFLP